MPCCGCNKQGVCVRCTCVKSGRSCSDCCPSRNGTCRNRLTVAPPSNQHYSRTCCGCNQHGVCIRCVCVQNGRRCSNCYPSRNGSCQNRQSASVVRDADSRSALKTNASTLPTHVAPPTYTHKEQNPLTQMTYVASPLSNLFPGNPFVLDNPTILPSHVAPPSTDMYREQEPSMQKPPAVSPPSNLFCGYVFVRDNPNFLGLIKAACLQWTLLGM